MSTPKKNKKYGPRYRKSRRLGVMIWGESHDAYATRNYPPGQHGKKGVSMPVGSDYAVHLRAKQRLKAHYGRVTEKQFKNTFARSTRMKGNVAENFVGLLERRLDMVVYRLSLAPTIFAARQLVSHGHVRVNGKKVDIGSAFVSVGDVITLSQNIKQLGLVATSVSARSQLVPGYLSFDVTNCTGKFERVPNISDVPYSFQPDVHLIVEFYSRSVG
ncbi:30S ribosomal protein S4 [Rickettsiales endosymbiont of Paramecium tredecaurelia]|uniref:30S ribosomal protein S4 n=1 Tax=Candidatus Sarmatiella mevalonica TaxID=2770581 RepID=UPI003132ABE7|nr:30S ribosomal protein S4 [Candidatus Sarmatiella mevalonica]